MWRRLLFHCGSCVVNPVNTNGVDLPASLISKTPIIKLLEKRLIKSHCRLLRGLRTNRKKKRGIQCLAVKKLSWETSALPLIYENHNSREEYQKVEIIQNHFKLHIKVPENDKLTTWNNFEILLANSHFSPASSFEDSFSPTNVFKRFLADWASQSTKVLSSPSLCLSIK